jgi:hypothetical protein
MRLYALQHKIHPERYKRVFLTMAAVSLMAAGSLSTAGPTQALGSAGVTCAKDLSANGASYTDDASTSTPSVAQCGYAQARASYEAYQGGPVYWTGWTTSSTYAVANPSQTVRNGSHNVNDASYWYQASFPFNT